MEAGGGEFSIDGIVEKVAAWVDSRKGPEWHPVRSVSRARVGWRRRRAGAWGPGKRGQRLEGEVRDLRVWRPAPGISAAAPRGLSGSTPSP